LPLKLVVHVFGKLLQGKFTPAHPAGQRHPGSGSADNQPPVADWAGRTGIIRHHLNLFAYVYRILKVVVLMNLRK